MLVIDQFHDVGSGFTPKNLRVENRHFQRTGGVSGNNCDQRFRPAFIDSATGRVYLSRFADGSPAPMHLIEGLPDELALQRNTAGRITAAKPGVISGFSRDGLFYTRNQAARVVAATAVTRTVHA